MPIIASAFSSVGVEVVVVAASAAASALDAESVAHTAAIRPTTTALTTTLAVTKAQRMLMHVRRMTPLPPSPKGNGPYCGADACAAAASDAKLACASTAALSCVSGVHKKIGSV